MLACRERIGRSLGAQFQTTGFIRIFRFNTMRSKESSLVTARPFWKVVIHPDDHSPQEYSGQSVVRSVKAIGRKSTAVLGFETEADAKTAAPLIKKAAATKKK
jgi:hypothetical protein